MLVKKDNKIKMTIGNENKFWVNVQEAYARFFNDEFLGWDSVPDDSRGDTVTEDPKNLPFNLKNFRRNKEC